MKGRFVSLIVILLSVYGIAVVDAFAATLVVTKTADTADGVCDADCSLRQAKGPGQPCNVAISAKN